MVERPLDMAEVIRVADGVPAATDPSAEMRGVELQRVDTTRGRHGDLRRELAGRRQGARGRARRPRSPRRAPTTSARRVRSRSSPSSQGLGGRHPPDCTRAYRAALNSALRRLSCARRPAARPQRSDMPQLLHLVFGGELVDPQRSEFRNVEEIDIVGIFPDYATAYAAWKSQGAGDRRQRPHALLHRASPPAAPTRSRRGADGEAGLGPGQGHDPECRSRHRISASGRAA